MPSSSTAVKPSPFVKWAGGKRQLSEAIKKRMPTEFNRYYEPFVGGGALYLELIPDGAVINDINSALMSAYRYIKDEPENLMSKLDALDSGLSEDPKPYYYQIRSLFNERLLAKEYGIDTAAMLIFINKHCFNGLYRVNSKGAYNVPCNGSKRKSYSFDNIMAVSRSLASATILNEDFETACSDAGAGDFVFFDSPYAPNNPTSFESYTKEGFAKEEHERLAALFRKLTDRGCYCILTNHNTKFINELYSGFQIDVVQVKRMINSDASKRNGTEVIIKNF